MKKLFIAGALFIVSLTSFAANTSIIIPVEKPRVVDLTPMELKLDVLKPYPQVERFLITCSLTTTGNDTQINIRASDFSVSSNLIIDGKDIESTTAPLAKSGSYKVQLYFSPLFDSETPFLMFSNIHSDPVIVSNCSALAK